MNEEEKQQEEKPKEEPELSLLEKVTQATEKANKAIEELNRKEEEWAKKMLGGQSEAGKPPVEEKVETPLEYKDRVMGGKI